MPYSQDEKKAASLTSHPSQPKTHLLPWRVLPESSYHYDDEEFGIHNKPFAFAADVAARIPITAEAIYILADNDQLGGGLISIAEDEDGILPSNKLQITMRVYADSHDIIRATNVSYVQSHHKEIGLRIHVREKTHYTLVRYSYSTPEYNHSGTWLHPQIHSHQRDSTPIYDFLPLTIIELPNTPPQLCSRHWRPFEKGPLQHHYAVIFQPAHVCRGRTLFSLQRSRSDEMLPHSRCRPIGRAFGLRMVS